MDSKILSNSKWLLAEKTVGLGSTLLVTPWVLRTVGLETWGAWVILNSIGSYISLGQFGLYGAIDKYIAECRALSPVQNQKKVAYTAWIMLGFLGVTLAIVGYFIGPPAFAFLTQSSVDPRSAFAVRWFVTLVAFELVNRGITAVANGFQRFDLTSRILILSRIVHIGTLLIVLPRIGGIYSLLLAISIQAACSFLLGVITVHYLLRGIPLSLKHFEFSMCRKFLRFGANLQVSFISSWISQNFDKFLLARWANLELVAIYDIGSRLAFLIRSFPIVIFQVLVPRVSELDAQGKRNEVLALYYRSTSFSFAIGCIFVVTLFPVASEILTIWLRKPVSPLSVFTFRTLLVSSMFTLVAGPGSSIGKGKGQMKPEVISNILVASLNILLSIILFMLIGFKGIVFGTMASYLIGTIVFLLLFHNQIDIAFATFLRTVFSKPLFLTSILVVGGIFLRKSARTSFHFPAALMEEIVIATLWFFLSGGIFLYLHRKRFGIQLRKSGHEPIHFSENS